MKIFNFRRQIILIVMSLALIPVIILGFNALYLAGRAQIDVDEIKHTMLVNITGELKEYFIRLNSNLSFTKALERLKPEESLHISGILLDSLSANREISAVGYVKGQNLDFYFGNDNKINVSRRLDKLLEKYGREKWVQISQSYSLEEEYFFDLLYPLENGDFVYLTYTLKEIDKKLRMNNVGETGKFAVMKDDGGLLMGSEDIKYRFKFLQMPDLLRNNIVDIRKGGYQVKAKKIDNILWPLWVVFTQKTSEADALTRQLKLGISVILLLLLAFSGVVSFTLASRFSRPISNLLDAVKKNYTGDLETKAVLKEKDPEELALLIKAFNEMIDNLKETREKLIEKEKLAVVGEMANVIGHDIRNPLSAIKNAAYYLRHVLGEDNERITATLGIVDREIESIQKIVEDLLGYSRQRPPVLAPVDVNSLVDEVLSIIQVPANVQILKEVSEKLPSYDLDHGEMRQVLVNLINNAAQACEKKEKGEVRVISYRAEDEHLKIRIKDNGTGIPGEKLDKVFQAFYSTKEGGTGLGLSSAKRIVERHEGTINIESEQGKGSEIIISIPPRDKAANAGESR
jgi:signal transduction histidine kinase